MPSGSRTPDDAFGRSDFTNLLAFTAGLDSVEISGRPVLPFSVTSSRPSIELEYTARQDSGSFSLVPQVSTNLNQWYEGPEHFTELDRIPLGDGTERFRLRLGDAYLGAPRAFVRLAAERTVAPMLVC